MEFAMFLLNYANWDTFSRLRGKAGSQMQRVVTIIRSVGLYISSMWRFALSPGSLSP